MNRNYERVILFLAGVGAAGVVYLLESLRT